MALSACKDDALVQGSDGKDVVANTVEDQIFKGRNEIIGLIRPLKTTKKKLRNFQSVGGVTCGFYLTILKFLNYEKRTDKPTQIP